MLGLRSRWVGFFYLAGEKSYLQYVTLCDTNGGQLQNKGGYMQTVLVLLAIFNLIVSGMTFFLLVAVWDLGGKLRDSLVRLHKLRAGADLHNWSFLHRHTESGEKGGGGQRG